MSGNYPGEYKSFGIFPVRTQLNAWSCIKIQPHYEAPGKLLIKIVEMVTIEWECSLESGPELTVGNQISDKKNYGSDYYQCHSFQKQPEMTKVFQHLPDLHEGNIKNYPNILKFAESTTDWNLHQSLPFRWDSWITL